MDLGGLEPPTSWVRSSSSSSATLAADSRRFPLSQALLAASARNEPPSAGAQTIANQRDRRRFELRETLVRLGHAPQGLAFGTLFEAELGLFERRTGRRVWITRHGEPRDLGPARGELLID